MNSSNFPLALLMICWSPIGLSGILTYYPCKYIFNKLRGFPLTTPLITDKDYTSGPYFHKGNQYEFGMTYLLGPMMPIIVAFQRMMA